MNPSSQTKIVAADDEHNVLVCLIPADDTGIVRLACSSVIDDNVCQLTFQYGGDTADEFAQMSFINFDQQMAVKFLRHFRYEVSREYTNTRV